MPPPSDDEEDDDDDADTDDNNEERVEVCGDNGETGKEEEEEEGGEEEEEEEVTRRFHRHASAIDDRLEVYQQSGRSRERKGHDNYMRIYCLSELHEGCQQSDIPGHSRYGLDGAKRAGARAPTAPGTWRVSERRVQAPRTLQPPSTLSLPR